MIGAIITIIFFLLKWVLIIEYFFLGLVVPFSIYIDNFEQILHNGTLFIIFFMLCVMVFFAFYISKKRKEKISTYFIIIAVISILIAYLLMRVIYKQLDPELYSLIALNGSHIENDLSTTFQYVSSATVIPNIVSTIVYKVLIIKEDKRNLIKEQEQQLKEQKRKQEIEDTNKEIEYLKKLNDLEKLLKEETINQERFDYLKSKLDKQYNKL